MIGTKRYKLMLSEAEKRAFDSLVSFLSTEDPDWINDHIPCSSDDLDLFVSAVEKAQEEFDPDLVCEKLIDSENAGYGIIKAWPLSNHPGDNFLFVVLARNDYQYVVWTYNAQSNGFGQGHYTVSMHEALEEVKRRRKGNERI